MFGAASGIAVALVFFLRFAFSVGLLALTASAFVLVFFCFAAISFVFAAISFVVFFPFGFSVCLLALSVSAFALVFFWGELKVHGYIWGVSDFCGK